MDVSHPSTRLIVALRLTTRLTSEEARGRVGATEGERRGGVSRVRCLEEGWGTREFVDTRSHRGAEHRGVSRFWEFDQGGAWVIDEPSDVVFEDVW